MYLLSRFLEPFVMPAGLVGIGLVFCSILLLKRSRDKVATIAVGSVCALYYLMATELTANLMLRTLEDRVQADDSAVAAEGVRAIVVLSGTLSVGPSGRPELNGPSWRRLWRGVEIYRSLGEKVPLVFSGGLPMNGTIDAGVTAQNHAMSWGVPRDHFWLESESRTTRESSFAVRSLLDRRLPEEPSRRIILVTSAWHMPRALAAFDRAGIAAIPAPCDYRSGRHYWPGVWGLVPTHEALSNSSTALHEWISFTAYQLTSSFQG